jgi:hypothetical protein
MKSTNKMDGDAFAIALAKEACSPKDTHVIIAQEAIDLKDEAKQSAQSYWMMGWTWDEIESVLEDSEYPKNVITYAIKETKEYAKKILNEGPFSVLKMGQVVKLVNGSTGILEEKYVDHITIDIKDVGKTKVSADQLDIVATEKLREAHSLRVKASNMLYKLSTDQLEHISVESQTVEPVLESVDNALSTMASLQQSSDEVKREAANLHSKWEADVGKWEPSSKEEYDFAQYLQVTLTGESQLDSEITDLFHNKLGTVLATLHDEIRKGAAITDTTIIDFLDNTFPSITEKLEGHLYGIKQRNVRAREYTQQFAKFGKEDADWKKDAVQWAVASWENTKKFMEVWETSLVPSLENGIRTVSGFLMNVDKQQVTASVRKALKTL